MIRHRAPISGIDAFADRYVATAGYDNQVILWDALSRRPIARSVHDHLVNSCRFSPDGTLLVTASSDYSCRIWRVPSLQLEAVLTGHQDDVEMAAFCPDGSRLATASRDHTIGIFGLDGTLYRQLRAHRSDVISVEWTANGEELVSTGDDGAVRRWSVETGRLVDTLELRGETDTLVVVDGDILAGNDEGAIVSISGGGVRHLPAHRAGIKRLVFDPRSRLLVSLSYDKTMRIWRVAGDLALELVTDVAVPDQVWIRSCCFAAKDSLAVGTFGSSYATFSLLHHSWDVQQVDDTPGLNAVLASGSSVYTVGDAGVVFRDDELLAHMGSLCNFLGAIGPFVVTGGQKGVLFDAETGRELYRHHSPLNCCAVFSRRGSQWLAVGAYSGEVLLFELREGQLLYARTVIGHDNAIKGLASNGRVLFGVCATGAAAFHSTDSFATLRVVPDAHRKISNGAAVLPDGRFVSVSRDLSLRVWSLDEVQEWPTPHTHSVKCVAASASGGLVATGSYDGSVALFDWQRGTWVHSDRPTASGISSLTPGFVEDEFLASSYDGSVYVVAAPHAGHPS